MTNQDQLGAEVQHDQITGSEPDLVYMRLSTAGELQLLNALKRQRHTGRVLFESKRGQQWVLHLCVGRVIYTTGGVHPVRRWSRQLKTYCPEINWQEASQVAPPSTPFTRQIGWEYEFLRSWVEQQKITRDQAIQVVVGAALEVLFDISQSSQVAFKLVPDEAATTSTTSNTLAISSQLALVDPERLVGPVHQIRQRWEEAKLINYTPNRAPTIAQPEQLRQQTTESVYKVLSSLLTGENTLRDLAADRKRDVVDLTASLRPYIEAGLVELRAIGDLPAPRLSTQVLGSSSTTGPSISIDRPLVACVDDSPVVCQTMEKIFQAVGYRFIAIQDSLRAIPTLLAQRPSLIFLDLVMPNTNGYEVCSQLRKTSIFRDVPIVILTGNDGIIDRVRAKVVGATDFLGKPVDAETVIAVAEKYLQNVSRQG
jgi:two-component system, chemotaxis family, response regulator PixG